MEDKTLNASQSVELIARMIRNTNQRMERGAGTPMLIWGYTTIAVTIAVAVALYLTHDWRWNFLWFTLPTISWGLMMLFIKRQPKGVATYIDRVVNYIWIVFGVLGIVVSTRGWVHGTSGSVLYDVLMIMGAGVALTGFVIKSRLLVIAGFIGVALSLFIFVPCTNGLMECALFVVGFAVMMVLPGHVLNYKARKQCSQN